MATAELLSYGTGDLNQKGVAEIIDGYGGQFGAWAGAQHQQFHDGIGIDRFGASAPAGDLFEKFGFTADAIVPQIMNKLNG